MKDKKRLRIEAECGKLPLLFAKYADNGDHAALADLLKQVQELVPTDDGTLGIDFFNMMRDMPLPKIIGWIAGSLPADPETMVDQLVAQVHNA